jgi:two-component system sensor histidine kinase VanS
LKAKYRLFNVQAFLRMALVGVASLAGCLLTAMLLSQIIDAVYRSTDSGFWRELFMLLSQYRVPIGILVICLGIALFSGWIMQPVFNSFAEAVASSLQTGDQNPQEVVFPKGLGILQTRVNDINKELRLWKYAIRESEQRKDDLVVYLAHDIRTPLTSVLGYLELVTENPELAEKDRLRYTGIALRKARRMQDLVEELFEITRFNVSHIELDKREVNASVFINQLAEEAAPLFRERGIEMTVENSGVETMFIDAEKLARAIENILGNAARYTPPGERVAVRLEPAGQDRACIMISNTGHEISKERLERFFEKFYRGDEARGGESGGAGLGLAIAKNLIEAHGGSVSAANENRETTFTIVV